MMKYVFLAGLFTSLLMGKVANADIRRDYKCKSLGYIEFNHAGRVKDIELEEFNLYFEEPYMVLQGGFSWFLSTKFHYKINSDLSIVSGNGLGLTFVFEKGQLTIAAIYPSTWSEATHLRGMTVLQAKCDVE